MRQTALTHLFLLSSTRHLPHHNGKRAEKGRMLCAPWPQGLPASSSCFSTSHPLGHGRGPSFTSCLRSAGLLSAIQFSFSLARPCQPGSILPCRHQQHQCLQKQQAASNENHRASPAIHHLVTFSVVAGPLNCPGLVGEESNLPAAFSVFTLSFLVLLSCFSVLGSRCRDG